MPIIDYAPVVPSLKPSNIIDTQFGFIDLNKSPDNIVINKKGTLVRFSWPPFCFFDPILMLVHENLAFYSVTLGQWVKNRTNVPAEVLDSYLKDFIASKLSNSKSVSSLISYANSKADSK